MKDFITIHVLRWHDDILIQELNKSKKPSIGALAHDGKVTQDYAKEMVNNVYEYVLLEKEV